VPASRDAGEAGGTRGPASDLKRSGARHACPSALCREGSLLLGVVTPGGTVGYVQPPTRIGADFVERAQAMGHPERRFRFSADCVEAACPQWTGGGCAVVDIAIQTAPAGSLAAAQPPDPAVLPACAIRHSCRWYAQRGAAACAVCPTVIADMGGTATYRSAQAQASAEAQAQASASAQVPVAASDGDGGSHGRRLN